MEATLYQVENIDSSSLAPLLFKVLEQQKKALIYCLNIDLINQLDNSLWSYGRNKFLPHITIFDKDFDLMRQPIILSNQELNANNADYLILLDVAPEKFIKNFSRVFCFYSNRDHQKYLNFEQDLIKMSYNTKSYIKDGNKWIAR